MSLSVFILEKHPGFDTSELEKQIPEPYNDLFGFESTRVKLWGHPVMLTLGCHMLSSLKSQNVYAFDEDVSILKTEINLIRKNIELVSTETGYDREFIDFRLSNVFEVIKIVENNLDLVGVAII